MRRTFALGIADSKQFKFNDLYEPIFDLIGFPGLSLKDIYNPNHVIWHLNHTRRSIKRRR